MGQGQGQQEEQVTSIEGQSLESEASAAAGLRGWNLEGSDPESQTLHFKIDLSAGCASKCMISVCVQVTSYKAARQVTKHPSDFIQSSKTKRRGSCSVISGLACHHQRHTGLVPGDAPAVIGSCSDILCYQDWRATTQRLCEDCGLLRDLLFCVSVCDCL